MSRIQGVLAKLKADGRKALIPYIACGDPHADTTAPIMLALAEGGADIIELGVPFSDPMADGPVIAKASERALARGIGLPQVLEAVSAFRLQNQLTPWIRLMISPPGRGTKVGSRSRRRSDQPPCRCLCRHVPRDSPAGVDRASWSPLTS